MQFAGEKKTCTKNRQTMGKTNVDKFTITFN